VRFPQSTSAIAPRHKRNEIKSTREQMPSSSTRKHEQTQTENNTNKAMPPGQRHSNNKEEEKYSNHKSVQKPHNGFKPSKENPCRRVTHVPLHSEERWRETHGIRRQHQDENTEQEGEPTFHRNTHPQRGLPAERKMKSLTRDLIRSNGHGIEDNDTSLRGELGTTELAERSA